MAKTVVVNMRTDEYDVCIDRRTKWGNPFPVTSECSRKESIKGYRAYLSMRKDLLRCLHELKGKRLGCWCKPLACHGDVLVDLIEKGVIV